MTLLKTRIPALCLAFLLLGCAAVLTAELPNPSSGHGFTTPNGNVKPPLPISKPPVDFFRELLAMPAPNRESFLSNRPPEMRARILEKVHEYEAMPAADRDLRLQMTELRWYMLQLLRTPRANRADILASVPDNCRDLVTTRLGYWDQLPKEQQAEVLEYESTLNVFVGQALQTNQVPIASFPAAQREEIMQNVERWNQHSVSERQQMYARFQKFFELSDVERQKTLNILSAPERRQMEFSLRLFSNLPADRREQCLKSFKRFASMSDAERDEFLKNAERWREMSAEERDVWRKLVVHVPTPLPPVPPPPLPGGALRPPPSAPLVTNGGSN